MLPSSISSSGSPTTLPRAPSKSRKCIPARPQKSGINGGQDRTVLKGTFRPGPTLVKGDDDDDDVWQCLLFVLAETKNRSQAPYIPLGRYVPHLSTL